MTDQEIERKLKEILSRKFGVDVNTIGPGTRLAEDLGVDSFGAVELMFEIEEAFSLKIPDSDMEHVRSVGDIVAYIRKWLDSRGKGPSVAR